MSRKSKKTLSVLVGGLVVLLLCYSPTSFAQKREQAKRVDPKLLEEIVGKYEFRFDEKSQVIIFSVTEGILMAQLEGEIPNELNPLDVEELTFVSYPPEGPEYHYEFLRDEEGKITKCIGSIPSMELKADGTRIKESE